MVIRLISVPEHLPIDDFHDAFRTILGWNSDHGYIIRVHGQEFNSFRQKTRSKALQEFNLDIQDGAEGGREPAGWKERCGSPCTSPGVERADVAFSPKQKRSQSRREGAGAEARCQGPWRSSALRRAPAEGAFQEGDGIPVYTIRVSTGRALGLNGRFRPTSPGLGEIGKSTGELLGSAWPGRY